MNEFLAAVIGALAVVIVPTVGWFSQRLTREGRLLLRIDRVGAAYALLPDSAEKSALEVHLRQAAADLNAWLEPDNKAIRMVRRTITSAIFILVVATLSTITTLAGIRDLAVTFALGLAAGGVAAVLSLILGTVAENAMLKRRDARGSGEPKEQASPRP